MNVLLHYTLGALIYALGIRANCSRSFALLTVLLLSIVKELFDWYYFGARFNPTEPIFDICAGVFGAIMVACFYHPEKPPTEAKPTTASKPTYLFSVPAAKPYDHSKTKAGLSRGTPRNRKQAAEFRNLVDLPIEKFQDLVNQQ